MSNSETPGHSNFIIVNSAPLDWRNPPKDGLWQGAGGINNPCPSGYRLPTEAEWEAERLSWESNDAAGAFASPLKLPLAGERENYNGLLYNDGRDGCYWSSTVILTRSRSLGFDNSLALIRSVYRAYGNSVRCIKD